MTYRCTNCRAVIAKEDRRRKQPILEAVPPAVLERRQNEAPAVKCVCGRRQWFIKGSV